MKQRLATLPIADVVFDFEIYPRQGVDSTHVSHLMDAFSSGADIPPPIIDEKSRRVVDGFHRLRARKRLYGDDHKCEMVLRRYQNEAAMFADAIRYNAPHGHKLSTADRARCLLIADRLKIEPDVIADAMHITIEKLGELRAERIGELRVAGQRATTPVALKRTIAHMAGTPLTAAQGAANEKLSGMRPMFYVNQLTMLLETDMMPINDETCEALRRLSKAIDAAIAAAK